MATTRFSKGMRGRTWVGLEKWLYGRFREFGVFRSDIGTMFRAVVQWPFVRYHRQLTSVKLAGSIIPIMGLLFFSPVGTSLAKTTKGNRGYFRNETPSY